MGIKLKIIAGLSVLLLTGSLLFWGHWERLEKEKAQEQVQDAQRSIKALLSTITSERESAERVKALAQSVQEELNDAENRYDRAIADAISGSAGLFVDADCPAGSKLPETSAPAREPDAARARVNRATEIDIRRLERDAAVAETMIDGLQEYIRSECGAKKSPD